MGRRFEGYKERWEIRVPESLAEEIETILGGEFRYGNKSDLVTQLLHNFVQQHKEKLEDGRNSD